MISKKVEDHLLAAGYHDLDAIATFGLARMLDELGNGPAQSHARRHVKAANAALRLARSEVRTVGLPEREDTGEQLTLGGGA